ncbi:hypothetical protein QBC38DRAFT_50184 [Podospora fimiseda]|uniref:Zn(2)-C6 fungal-type domain-containing protein n=1 Tax=Podospora fimiseda TaxID=252190 RepID=A0AAN7H6D0_9PEZI|nr:hypothetical protein QBC38DRAFT_50184 [Podospora fimiseda]
MDPGPPDPKRPRVMPPDSSSWPSSLGSHSHHHPHHGGVSSLLNPNPSPTTTTTQPPPPPHHTPTSSGPPPPPPPPYQHSPHLPSPHHYPRPHTSLPPPPPPPPLPPSNAQTPIGDRRHHEPERYPPIHDHRQPPHSPAPSPYPGYSARDHIEKSGLLEDNTLPQIRRPLSTETMTPATPHSAIPPSPYGDEKRHMSYDNGPQRHPIYQQPNSYPPQPPMPHAQPFDFPPHSFASPHDGPPYPIQIATTSGKRKAQRASQACESCRALKAKCDEMKPCKGCKEKKQECRYRETAPKQQDKVQADILDTILALSAQFHSFNERMIRMENALKHAAPAVLTQAESTTATSTTLHEEDERPPTMTESPTRGGGETRSSSPPEEIMRQVPDVPEVIEVMDIAPPNTEVAIVMPAAKIPTIDVEQARTIARNMQIDDEKEAVAGPIVTPKAPTIPPNHTTPASNLLKWPPIYELTKRYMSPDLIKHMDEFPVRNEEKRGILRLWGRGEGYDGSRMDAQQDLGAVQVHDDVFDSAGAPSPSDCWGSINGSPGPDGRLPWQVHLDFNEHNVWTYVSCFNENIQNMHPLLIPEELQAMVKLFLSSVHGEHRHRDTSGGNPSVAKFVEMTGSKRKRSRSPAHDAPDTHFVKGRPTFQRSINNCIVLLVLALGKLCKCSEERIPEPAPLTPTASSHHHNIILSTETPDRQPPHSPMQTSSPSHSAGRYPQSPKDGSTSSRRSSGPTSGRSWNLPSASGSAMDRNMDRIPGLDYFAYATDILGGQMGGFSIRHVHAHILAGLFYGQLGRVVESYSHIKQASWALQTKLRPSMDQYRRLQEQQTSAPEGQTDQIQDKVDNLLVIAFWSILQLESDIVAELPLPQSHILAFEDMMPFPNVDMAKEWGFDDDVLQSYLAQLYLRKNLNQIHLMLYNPDNCKPLAQLLRGSTIVETIEHALDMRFIPEPYKFDTKAPPASDILSARLRAKYWGAQVITYRPFVRQIIEWNYYKTRNGDVPMSGTVNPDFPQLLEPHDKTYHYAEKGINALVQSTQAFHNVQKRRYIVTNIFGTAHAQWGNLLTLAASFHDPTLRQWVDERKLQALFAKTIELFRIITVPNSALEIDLRILEGIQWELWKTRPYSLLPGEVPPPHACDLPLRAESVERMEMRAVKKKQDDLERAEKKATGNLKYPHPPRKNQQMGLVASPRLLTLPNGNFVQQIKHDHNYHALPPPPTTPVDMKPPPNLMRTPLPGPPLQYSLPPPPPPPIKTEGGVSPHLTNGFVPPMHR